MRMDGEPEMSRMRKAANDISSFSMLLIPSAAVDRVVTYAVPGSDEFPSETAETTQATNIHILSALSSGSSSSFFAISFKNSIVDPLELISLEYVPGSFTLKASSPTRR